MTYQLDKTRIRNAKAKHDASHCDRCGKHVGPMDRLSQPAPGKVRCSVCTRLHADEEAPTAKIVRIPLAPPPCGVAS